MKNQEKSNKFILFFLLSLAFFLRICFIPNFLGGWDSVDFALGVREYDILKYQPHFPGYPVYMFFAKLVFLVFNNEVYSLMLTSVFFGGLTIVPFYYLCSDMYDKPTALLGSLLLIINPLHWLLSTKALSDIMGLFFVVSSVCLLYKAVIAENQKNKLRFVTWASLILGTGLGVRISYFPHIILLGLIIFVCSRQVNTGSDKIKIVVYPLLAFIGSFLAWFIPQILVSGHNTLIHEGMKFLNGHFTEWGGTIFTHPNVIMRLKELFIQDILTHGLGGGGDGYLRLWVTLFMAMGLLFYVCKEPFNFKNIFLIFWCLPYLLWVLYAQNLNNPRHILATLPVLLLIISRGIIAITVRQVGATKRTSARCPKKLYSKNKEKSLKLFSCLTLIKTRNFGYVFIIALLSSLFCVSFNLVSVHAKEKPAMLKLVNYVQKEYDPTETIIFCWETKRLFDFYAPEYITVREDSDDIEASVAYYFYGKPKIILATSDIVDRWILKGKKLKNKLEIKKHFNHNPYVANNYNSIYLYQLGI